MKCLLILLKLFFRLILPYKIFYAIYTRILRTKNIILSYKTIRIALSVIVYPFKLIYDLVKAFLKIILIWSTRLHTFEEIKRIFNGIVNTLNEFYIDLQFRNYDITDAKKRFILKIKLILEGREKRKSFGDKNADKIFFVIRPYFYYKPNIAILGTQQLLSNYFGVLHYLAIAKKYGWIPVIDWENYLLPHSENRLINGTRNAWEYFWMQPTSYTLKEVYKSKNVVLSHQNLPFSPNIPPLRATYPLDNYIKNLIKFCPEYSRMIPLNNFVTKHIDKIQEKLFPQDKKILGVALRGSSYRKDYNGHYLRQPTLEELINIVRQYKVECNMDFIFFTNEEEETVKEFKNVFRDEAIIMPRVRYKNYHKYSDNDPSPSNEDLNPLYIPGQRYNTSLDYLTEMTLLSRCHSFVGGMSGGVRAAIIWNAGKFEHIKIIDRDISIEKNISIAK